MICLLLKAKLFAFCFHNNDDSEIVLQMSSTRSTDQKTTLLHFLANTVEQRHPDLLNLSQELRNIEPASRGIHIQHVLLLELKLQ